MIKKVNYTIILSATVIAVAAFGYSWVHANSTDEKLPELFIPGIGQETAGNFNVTFNSAQVNLPKEKLIYKFIEKDIAKDDVMEQAKLLGLSQASIKENSVLNSYIVEDDEKHLEIEKGSGKLVFINKNKTDDVNINGQAKNIPSDDEAIRYATEFLKKMKWLPDTFEPSGVTKNTIIPGDMNSETTDGFVASKTVHFYQKIDNEPVLGVSRIMVEVGHNGEIDVVKKYHKEIEPFKAYDLKTVEQAVNDFKSNKSVHDISEGGEEITIENITLGYYEDPGKTNEQPYLQPVYVLTGKYDLEGKELKFSGVVPAVSNQFIEPAEADSSVIPAQNYPEKEGK